MEIRVSTIPRTPKRQIRRCARRWCRRLRSQSRVHLLGGDIVYNGYDKNDWKVWDSETALWREKKIRFTPRSATTICTAMRKWLANYFERFPDLKNSRYYSVHAGNTLYAGVGQLSMRPPARKGNGSPRNWTIFPAI